VQFPALPECDELWPTVSQTCPPQLEMAAEYSRSFACKTVKHPSGTAMVGSLNQACDIVPLHFSGGSARLFLNDSFSSGRAVSLWFGTRSAITTMDQAVRFAPVFLFAFVMCLTPLQPTPVAPGTCARSALRFFFLAH